jgi:neopullulanase
MGFVPWSRTFRSPLAPLYRFPYPCVVAKRLRRLLPLLFLAFASSVLHANGAPQSSDDGPAVTKVEPPNWWLNLTPEVMLLLTGRGLDASKVECNLNTILVERTESTSGGKYLFVWLKIGPETKSGTVVCRVAASSGTTSFELPLAARTETIHKYQGLTPADVIYLTMPDRFANGDPTNDEPSTARGSHDRSKPRAYHGGDLRGVRDHLEYLKDLGVTTVWLTPVVRNGATEDYHGYGAVDLYSVDPHLGTLRDYQDVVESAHRLRMKILFDIVPNHVGPHHPWVAEPPMSDWFHGTTQRHTNSSTPGVSEKSFYGESEAQSAGHDPFAILADPHAPPVFSRGLTEGWFFGFLPDLNTENPNVVQYLTQNAIWWAESSGLDGYRIDTFPYVSRVFWSRWHASLRRIYPHLTTIGEVFHPDPAVTSFFVGGQKRADGIDTGVSTVFDYPIYFALRDVLLHDAPAARIADILRHDGSYLRPDELVTFFANHDVARFASASGSSSAKQKLAFGVALTLRGIPQLYYGDEIGMPGGDDPDNRHDFPGGWTEDPKNAFTEAGRTPDQAALFNYVQELLRIRRAHPALSVGRLWHLASDDTNYVFLRQTEEENALVVFHKSAQPQNLRIPLADTPIRSVQGVTPVLGNAKVSISSGELKIEALPESLSIFILD